MDMTLKNVLDGKRVLIIGGVGTHTIGRAITQAVGAAGASGIAVTGRDLARVREAAEEVASASCKAVGIAGNVRDGDDIERSVAETIAQLGGLDVLITNVGGSGIYATGDALHETPDEHWDGIFDLNVRYVFRYIRPAIKQFLAQGTGGTIVSIGSTAAVLGMPHAAAYGAAKAALSSLCKSVAAEYARRDIRMNVVNCGAIDTTRAAEGIKAGVRLDNIPMGRPGKPEEVGAFVVYLASPLSVYMTGQSVNFDGGLTSRYPLRLPKNDPSMSG